MRVTPWERVSLWRRVLAAFVRVTILFLVVIVLAYLAYAERYQLGAKIWHWKHGYSTRMGNYEVPVPAHWLILDQNSVAFTLMDTARTLPRRDGKFHTAAVIDIFPFRNRSIGTDKLDFWLSLKRQWLEREGVKSIEEKKLTFGDDAVSCIGGSELRAIMRDKPNFPDTEIISLECKSAADLSIMFVGEPSDLPNFYTFVSEIRKHRQVDELPARDAAKWTYNAVTGHQVEATEVGHHNRKIVDKIEKLMITTSGKATFAAVNAKIKKKQIA